MHATVDVAIIGAGPAGSTAAALLAEQGLSVMMVERDNFPRFKIGESLLPGGNAMLRRLGLWDKMDDHGFLRKYGAEFVSYDGSQRVHNIFAEGLVNGMDYTYQVERARFDTMLRDNAAAKGASVLQPAKVTAVAEEADGWRIEVKTASEKRAIAARWLLDCSGRSAFLGRRLRLEQDNIPYPKRFAVYSHFSGVARASGREGGNIIITRLSDGWFWAIPLDADKTSVGVVATRNRQQWQEPGFTPDQFFYHEVTRSPYLSQLMRDATPVDKFHVTADYTYSHSHYGGSRYMLVGDAAGFIDPVFSSGVYLAMSSAGMAADAVLAAHRAGRPLSQATQTRYTRQLKKRVRVMRDLIEVFYDSRRYSLFMAPSNRFQLFQAVNSIVAGNCSPGFSLHWRYRLFLLLCKLNRRVKLAPMQPFE